MWTNDEIKMKDQGTATLTTTQDNFVDYEITETLGLVRGNTIRARHVGKDIMAMLRTIVGGEITEYTKMLAESREQALDRMYAEAKQLLFCATHDPLNFHI